MSAPAPNFAVSVNRALHVCAADGHDIEGELLAIGWNVPLSWSDDVWPLDGLFYLVLDRHTALPTWVGEHEVHSIGHERRTPLMASTSVVVRSSEGQMPQPAHFPASSPCAPVRS